MIYVPNRFLFIHIPRTAGNAITRALGRELLRHSNPVIVTSKIGTFERHSRAIDLRSAIPEFDSLIKYSISRPIGEIIASDYRLHRNVVVSEHDSDDWKETVKLAVNESLGEFTERRWVPWMGGVTPWRHWCCDETGRELGVQRIEFSELPSRWDELCKAAGCQSSIPFDRWDSV